MIQENLFELPTIRMKKIDVLPASVIDIEPQSGERRSEGGHDKNSSRQQYSHFPNEVLSICYELFLKGKTNIFDPFAGWGERAQGAKEYGFKYFGYDINPKAIQYANKNYGVSNKLANSLTEFIPSFDGLITCPPYWNLEQYSSSGIDSEKTWEDFLRLYWRILHRTYQKADMDAVFCIMVGDWRKDGVYYNLTHKTRCYMEQYGAEIVDEVIVSRKGISKIKVMIPQAVRLGYTVKVHETLLVFIKKYQNEVK